MTEQATRRAIDAVWRIESARLIAGLARVVRDVGLAEDLAQDALVVALERWPQSGVPDNPGAWLMATAKHRAIDTLRHRTMAEGKHADIARRLEEDRAQDDLTAQVDEDVGDDLLRLIFTTCHPALSTQARAALTLRLLGGMSTGEIARAFLVPEKTIGQRISRAKRTLTETGIQFEAPGAAERPERLASVLEVVYLIFNEGYTATSGADWLRPDLSEEALRLGRVLARVASREAEVLGLLALMELQHSRSRARLARDGSPVLLGDQDRSRWDRAAIVRGLEALRAAQALGTGLGTYFLQAAIAACHAQSPSAQATDWERIAALYDALAQLHPSPVVELNRAVAHAMAFGPEEGLALADSLDRGGKLAAYHLLPSVRGDLLSRLGRAGEARREFERAAALTGNERERRLLLDRAAVCAEASDS